MQLSFLESSHTLDKAKKALRRKLKPLAGDEKLQELERVVTETFRYITETSLSQPALAVDGMTTNINASLSCMNVCSHNRQGERPPINIGNRLTGRCDSGAVGWQSD